MDTEQGKVKKKYFIGDSLENKWCTVYHYRPVAPDIAAQKGEVFATVSLFAPKGFNATTAGNLIVDRLHESYFESKKQNPLDAITHAIKQAQERLAELLVNENDIAKSGVDLNIALIIMRGEEVFFASFGSNKIITLPFQDSKKYLDITASLRDPFGKGIVKIGSSYLAPDQRFAICSARVSKELSDDELLYSLTSLSDLRFKSKEFDKPEEVAVFLIGYDVNLRDAQPEQRHISHMMENAPESISLDELPVVSGQEDEEILTEDSAKFEVADEGVLAAEMDSAAAQEDEFASDTAKTEVLGGETHDPLNQRLENIKLKVTSAASSLFTGLTQRLKSLRKGRFSERERRDKLKERLARTDDDSNMLSEVLQGRRAPDTSNMSTMQVIMTKAKYRFLNIKDIVLYDLLQVNQGGKFTIRKNSLSFKLLIFFGVLILIFISFRIISSIGESRERANKIIEATDQLTSVRAEIDKLETSPVLNSRSTGDILQRESLLEDVNRIEAKFTADFELLPQNEVELEENRLSQIRKNILKQREVSLNILVDIGNKFEGKISDFAIVGKNVYIVDEIKGSVYRQPITGGEPEVIAEGLAQPKSIAIDTKGDLVVYEAGANNVITLINPATKQKRSVPGISKDKLVEAKQMSVYNISNGLYTIAAAEPSVFQLNRSGDSYTLPRLRYNLPGVPSFNDIEILDGAIFLLVPGKGISRIGADGERTEAFVDVKNSVAQAKVFGSDTELIYVSDAVNNRVLIFTKSRDNSPIYDFVSQAGLDNIGEVTEISADKTENMVFLAASNRIYTFTRSSLF